MENEIRGIEVAQHVSHVSSIKAVRERLVALQREIASQGGVVMDGRDIGTVVLPNAELKVFMTADVKVRALRRQKELLAKNQQVDIDDLITNLMERDEKDSTRKESPLKKANDAIEIDTTHLSFDEQTQIIVDYARKIISSDEE